MNRYQSIFDSCHSGVGDASNMIRAIPIDNFSFFPFSSAKNWVRLVEDIVVEYDHIFLSVSLSHELIIESQHKFSNIS